MIDRAGGPEGLIRPEAWEGANPHSALALAMLKQESSYGTDFDQNPATNHNPLNLKLPAGGGYVWYPTWAEGVAGWANRITSATYKSGVYADTRTIAELIDVFAPPEDQSKTSTDDYIVTVVSLVNRWLPGWKPADAVAHAGESSMTGTFEYPGLTIINSTDWKGTNRPGSAFNPGGLFLIEHDTGNTNIGANARMHRDFVRGGGGDSKVSFHATGDGSHTVYQLLPLDEIGWHAADGCDDRAGDWGCFASAAYEMCINGDMSVWESYSTAKDWAAAVILGDHRIDYGRRKPSDFSVDRIRSHKQASAVAWGGVGKDCSHWQYANRLFPDDFVAGVKARVAQHSAGVPAATDSSEIEELFPGFDYGIATRLFGEPTGEDGRRYRFSRTGPVSNKWLDRGKATGQWPELVRVLSYDEGRRRYFTFEDGWTIFAGPDGMIGELKP